MADVTPKFPKVVLNLTGQSGINLGILARAQKAMRKAGLGKNDTDNFFKEVGNSDFNTLVRVCSEWFTLN
jgi:hypothetical protein